MKKILINLCLQMIINITFAIYFILLWSSSVNGIIGYDCGRFSSNSTTISITEVGDCDIHPKEINTTEPFIQLLQLKEYSLTKVIQCKIEVDRNIYYCGAYSHMSVVHSGHMEYIEEISKERCLDIHKSGSYRFGTLFITGLKINSTTTRGATLAGSIGNDGTCKGGSYSDFYGSWSSIVAQGVLKITIQEYFAEVKYENDKVYLKSGLTCTLSDLSCLDLEGGYTFWDYIPSHKCDFQNFGVLYTGKVNKTSEKNSDKHEIVYSLESNGITFALTTTNIEIICGYKIIRTEHPKLFIFETSKNDLMLSNKISIENLDLFAYINSKFVYVEKFIQKQIKQLYYDVLIHRCMLERNTLKNLLSIASSKPDEFAYNYMKGPGYIAIMSGESINVVKCIPVEVSVYPRSECYNELPVKRANDSYFLTPKTRILVRKGTQIDCNPLFPPLFLIDGSWYKFTPNPVEVLPPNKIQPLTKPTWKYTSPKFLATSGIYSEQDLDKLRHRIMSPVEKPAILSNIARGMDGLHFANQGESILNLFDTNALQKLADSAWEKTWGKFVVFGSASAGIFSIIMIIRLVKFSFDTLLHAFQIRKSYGCSFYMCLSFWDACTNFILIRAQENNINNIHKSINNNNTNSSNDENVELVIIQQPTQNQEIQTINENTEPSAPSADEKIYPILPASQEENNGARIIQKTTSMFRLS